MPACVNPLGEYGAPEYIRITHDPRLKRPSEIEACVRICRPDDPAFLPPPPSVPRPRHPADWIECLACRAYKPITAFGKHKGRAYRQYRQIWCKDCTKNHRVKQAKWYRKKSQTS